MDYGQAERKVQVGAKVSNSDDVSCFKDIRRDNHDRSAIEMAREKKKILVY
jgi:hypothetical protein